MAAVGVEILYASFLISKRKRVSLLESNEGTFPEASIGYLLASQACAYSSTHLSLDSEVGNTMLFFPQVSPLWGGGHSLPPKENRLYAEPSKTNRKIQQIFNTLIKNIMMNKGFCVCISNAQSQSIDLKEGKEYKIPIVLACVTEYTQAAGSLIDFRLSLLFWAGMPLNSLCADV